MFSVRVMAAVLALTSAAWRQTGAAAPAATRPAAKSDVPTGASVTRDIVYAKVAVAAKGKTTATAPATGGSNAGPATAPAAGGGEKEMLLDLFLPAKVPGGPAKVPLVVWIHGGAFLEGSKKYCQGSWLAAHGYAVASINYRLSIEAAFPAQIHDCKAAVRFLRANAEKYGIDPDRIGVYGESAGGTLAALMGTSNGEKAMEGTVGEHLGVSSDVQAVCDRYGATDFTQKEQFADLRDARLRVFATMVVQRLLGVSQDDPTFLEKARAASPVTYVSKGDPPFLILHGDKDPLVPLEQSKMLHAALQKAGVSSTLEVVPGASHGFRPSPEKNRQINAFYDQHLKQLTAK